jgi:hypothetical protein
MHSMNFKLNFIALNNSFTSHQAVLHFDSFLNDAFIFHDYGKQEKMALTGPHTLSFDRRSEWSVVRGRYTYLSSSSNRRCRRNLIFLAINHNWNEGDDFDFASPISCLQLCIFSFIGVSV